MSSLQQPAGSLTQASGLPSAVPQQQLPADQAAAMERLQELQQRLVGGEKTQDVALKKKLAARRRHADQRREMLIAAAEEADDDGIMEAIYDSLQDEIKAKGKQLVKTQEKLKVSRRRLPWLL